MTSLLTAYVATMIFNQSEQYAVYTSVGTTVLGSSSPFFTVATSLNPPDEVDCFDGAGQQVWSFTNGTAQYLVDTARHAEGADTGPVDVAVAACGDAGCTLFGRTSATDTTRWALPLPDCGTNVEGGTYVNMEASDSGNRVAFLCHFVDAGNTSARVYLVDMQEGLITWTYDLGEAVKAGQGQVQITPSGSFVLFVNEGGVPTPNSATAFVLDGATGALRDAVPIPFFITAAISDSGDYVAVGDDGAVHVLLWDAGSGKYKASNDLQPSPNFIPWDIQISTGADATEAVVVGSISGDVKTVAVENWALATGVKQGAWVSATNPVLQENPTLRTDGDYIGVSLWGNEGDVPTVVLLSKTSDAPLFTFTSPGSMAAVDLNVVSGAGGDVIYLAAAGKAVPANRMGNGGNAYGWRITQQ